MQCEHFNSMDYISFNRMLIQMHLVKMLPLFALESARLYSMQDLSMHACFNDYQIVCCIFSHVICHTSFFALNSSFFFALLSIETHEHGVLSAHWCSLQFSIIESVAIESNGKVDDGESY